MSIPKDKKFRFQQRYAGILLMSTERLFLLQRRDRDPAIVNPGLVGIFGGLVEPGESFEECAIREVNEELELRLSNSEMHFLAEIEITGVEIITVCRIYLVDKVMVSTLRLHEGEKIEQMTLADWLLAQDITPLCEQVRELWCKMNDL